MTGLPPPIKVDPAGRVLAGPWLLEPSHRLWRKRRAFWRCRDLATNRVVCGWCFTPSLALAAAANRGSPPLG